jgi:hypothetical protein
VSCTHPAGTITDHTVQGFEDGKLRYAWRGTCLNCRRGVVGVTALPAGLSSDRLNDLLNAELMSYFGQPSTASL